MVTHIQSRLAYSVVFDDSDLRPAITYIQGLVGGAPDVDNETMIGGVAVDTLRR